MARKKTTKKKSTKRDPERTHRNQRIALTTAVLLGGAAVFVGAAMGIGEINNKASQIIAPEGLQVQINWPTNADGNIWLPLGERENIEKQILNAVQGGQPLSQEPLKEAGIALNKSGWIKQFPTVRWTSDGIVSIEADWRIPAGSVRVGTREIIIDWDRYVLPLDYAIGESNQHFFINADARLPEIGQQWVGTDLKDGLELFATLSEENLLEQIAGFDLGKDEESGIIRIITNRQAEIIWGAGPGRERPGEVPTGVKIDRLRAIYNKSGLIDGGTKFIDIRGSEIRKKRADG